MRSVVFRPTNSCNLRCTYCYDKDNHNTDIGKTKKKATDLFEKEEDNIIYSLDKLYENEKNPVIIFHGGEPLLIKSEVLDRFCEKIKKNRNLTISIQTNGTLIDDEVVELFKKHDFKVGISLDGCNEKQNSARVYQNGDNSYNKVMNNIKLLQENDIKFGVIMSINKAHIDSERELYDFIGKNNISCNIRPIFASSEETKNQMMNSDEYINFFTNLFDIWYEDKEQTVRTHQISELYQGLRKVLDNNYHSTICNNSNRCFKDFISLDVYSNLYSCNRLYGIDKFYYGNLLKDDIDTINKKIEVLLNERNTAILNKCGDCDSISTCYGGCPAESYDLYHDLSHPTINCEIDQKIHKYIKEKIK